MLFCLTSSNKGPQIFLTLNHSVINEITSSSSFIRFLNETVREQSNNSSSTRGRHRDFLSFSFLLFLFVVLLFSLTSQRLFSSSSSSSSNLRLVAENAIVSLLLHLDHCYSPFSSLTLCVFLFTTINNRLR